MQRIVRLLNSEERRLLLFILICFLGGFCCNNIFSQVNYSDIRFNHIRTSDDLSNSSVTDVAEDSCGFIWIGTYNGLNRYDGHKIIVYQHNSDDSASLCSNRINALETDGNKRLWVGTAGGLNLYDYSKDRFYSFRNDKTDTNSILSNAITYLFYDSINNFLWISTDPDGLCRLDLNNFDINQGASSVQFYRYDYKKINGITAFMISSKNQTVLLGRSANVHLYNPKTDDFQSFPISEKYDEHLDRKSKRLLTDTLGNWWLASGGQLYVLKDIGESNREIKLKQLTQISFFTECLMLDIYGNIWVGQEGVYVYDPIDFSIISKYKPTQNPHSFSNSEIQCIYQDNNDNVWIGTRDDGVNMCLFKPNFFTHYFKETNTTSGISEKVVTSILNRKDGTVWFSTYDGGITVLDKETGLFRHITTRSNNGLSTDKVLDLFEDKDGDIWAGTWAGGLIKINASDKSILCEDVDFNESDKYGLDCIWHTVQDSAGRLWLASQEVGVILFDKSDKNCVKYPHDTDNSKSIRGNMVISLLLDSKNRLFAGTYLGLDMVDLKEFSPGEDLEFFHFPAYPSLKGLRINHIYEDSKGYIWVSTDGNGLSVMTPDLQQIKNYTVEDGLPGDVVTAVAEDSTGNFWISTQKGLVNYKPDSEEFLVYDETQGLFISEFRRGSVATSERGDIYMGSVNGVVIFNPDKKPNKYYSPDILLEDLYVGNEKINIGEEYKGRVLLKKKLSLTDQVVLLNNENTFTLTFTSINFVDPADNYYYRLDGLDTTWHHLKGENQVTYQKLASGKYTFRVRDGRAEYGLMSDEATLDIEVKQSFFKTPYFILALIMFIAGLIWYFYGYFQRKIESLKDTLEMLTMDKEKYSSSKLDKSMSDTIRQKLEEYMVTERPFLNPELKQADVADAIEVPVHELSQVINQDLQTTYREYINRLRIKAFIEKMKVADMSKFTIMAIAEQCGFNSKSSFYRSFKKETGSTPAEYFSKPNN